MFIATELKGLSDLVNTQTNDWVKDHTEHSTRAAKEHLLLRNQRLNHWTRYAQSHRTFIRLGADHQALCVQSLATWSPSSYGTSQGGLFQSFDVTVTASSASRGDLG